MTLPSTSRPHALKAGRRRQPPAPRGLLRDPVDVHIGGRLRLRRRMLGLSQNDLARQLDVTCQQVCKYEAGDNRISAAKLYSASDLLSCPIAYFFEGLGGSSRPTRASTEDAERIVHHFLSRPDAFRLAGEFPKIRSRRLRRQLMRLVTCLAEEVSARG